LQVIEKIRVAKGVEWHGPCRVIAGSGENSELLAAFLAGEIAKMSDQPGVPQLILNRPARTL
jgi:hypothetical protein